MSTSTTVYAAPRSVTSNPLLVAYLARLTAKPLQTKAFTAGFISLLQEVLANHFAGVPIPCSKDAPIYEQVLAKAKINARALKMGAYGFFISGPMNHVLVGTLQKVFAGKTSGRDRLLQLLASNIFIAPIQATVYLSYMAFISGARSVDAIAATVQKGLLPMLKILWITTPTASAIAQQFLPPELWVPFFNLAALTVGTFFSVKVKKMQLAAARKAKRPDTKGEKDL